MNHQRLVMAAIVLLALVSGTIYLNVNSIPLRVVKSSQEPIDSLIQDIISDDEQLNVDTLTSSTNSTSSVENSNSGKSDEISLMNNTEEHIYVFLCGEVKNAGVYELEKGSRVIDALELAGGITDIGDPDYVNLARVLIDGESIYFPQVEQVLDTFGSIEVTSSSDEEKLININTASTEMLMSLPGIGEAKAEAIIYYRENVLSFSKIEDLMNVSGIKEASFNKLADKICVE